MENDWLGGEASENCKTVEQNVIIYLYFLLKSICQLVQAAVIWNASWDGERTDELKTIRGQCF